MKTCPVCGCDALEGAVIQERRRIRRAQRIPIHTLRQALKSLPDADEKAAALNDLEELDAATRAPKRRSR